MRIMPVSVLQSENLVENLEMYKKDEIMTNVAKYDALFESKYKRTHHRLIEIEPKENAIHELKLRNQQCSINISFMIASWFARKKQL